MRPVRVYKKSKKTTVQLTSLLDLLFVMIFVSLIQQKDIPTESKQKTEPKKAPEVVEEIKTPKPKTQVVEQIKEKPKIEKRKYSISAIFHFHPTAANPKLPSGTYMMQGSFDEKTRELHLGGVSWIKRPQGYDMVPLSGKIENSETLFKGRIDFPGCKIFNLKRTEVLDNSPISGKWKGVYDCSQGLTGLTLTIQ
ncbi:MAG: hypothetical protein QF441_11290 [Bacteriovoracaceae bacterium]|jgi:hypothetical protein|nr:hypothetical protein [Halobacteriovoraceae bacterium]MDP7321187.1 hypothetical protein [Bacteriovoracaceae bacterium]